MFPWQPLSASSRDVSAAAASQLESRQTETVSDKDKFKVALLISQKQKEKVCVVYCSMYSIALWTRNIVWCLKEAA